MASYPKYEAVKQFVLSRIQTEKLGPGDRLPSEAELSKALNVSAITIKKALGDLASEGLVTRIRGKGSFVAEKKQVQKSHMAAMLFALNDIEDSAFSSLILGAQAYLSHYSYSLLVEVTGEDLSNAKNRLSRLIAQGVDGFIFYLCAPDKMLELVEMAQAHRPVVMMDRRPTSKDTTYVGCNNVGGALKAVNHLLEMGHTRIGYVHFNPHLNSEQERYLGYANALAKKGINLALQHQLNFDELTPETLAQAAKEGRATAYFGVNDTCALKLIEVLSKAGLRVPEDISVVGFDNCAQVRSQNIPLTTLEQNFEEIGRETARLLLKLVQKRVQPDTQLLLGARLIERGSVGKAKGHTSPLP